MADNTDAILAAIRRTEGSAAYNAAPKGGGSASGAYQFTDSTWIANGGGSYAPHAYQATKDQQDAVAARKVNQILAANNGDVSAVPQVWYLGHVASAAELDRIPHPEAGNKLTVRQYVEKWLKNAAGLTGGAVGSGNKGLTDLPAQVASAVLGALGDLVDPFVGGLKKLSIVGLSVTLGLGLVGLGAWRSVKGTT